MNAIWMLKNIITDMYDKIVTNGDEETHALIINFKVKNFHCHMLIYGMCRYKGVYIVNTGGKEKVEIECIGYHDSCWRNCVEDYIRENSDTIHFNIFPDRTMYEVVEKLTKSITVVKLRDDQTLALLRVRKERYEN